MPRPPLTLAQSLAARARWHRCCKRIKRLLRLRRLWAAVGRYLQADNVQAVVDGLERRGGRLVRLPRGRRNTQ